MAHCPSCGHDQQFLHVKPWIAITCEICGKQSSASNWQILRKLADDVDYDNETVHEQPPKRSPARAAAIIIENVHYMQTGGQSVVNQTFGISEQDFLEAVLSFQRAVQASANPSTNAISATVEEIVAEAKSQCPDRSKIARMLSGLSQVVQSAGALPNAWNALTSVATVFTGHHFPQFPST